MPSPTESRAALELVTSEAIATSTALLAALDGSAESRRLALLENVPSIVGYYSDGSAALAVDFYEEQRELAGVGSRFTAEVVVVDRTVKLRSAIAWAAEPLFAEADDLLGTSTRLAEVIQLHTARPYRDTILANRRSDPASVGWRRITRGGCKFCRMLADRGAIYKQGTALFAAHPSCHCTAQPVFTTTDTGVEASVMQYMASKRTRTAAQRADLRKYLDTYY